MQLLRIEHMCWFQQSNGHFQEESAHFFFEVDEKTLKSVSWALPKLGFENKWLIAVYAHFWKKNLQNLLLQSSYSMQDFMNDSSK